MSEEIDFGTPIEEIEGGDSFVIESGRYLAKINAFEKQKTKAGDKHFINCEFELLDCEDTRIEVSLGRKVWDLFNFNEEALWKIKSLLKAIYPDLTGSKVPKNIAGQFVSIFVYKDNYDPNREQFRAKAYQTAEGWSGLNFSVEDGKLISMGGGMDAKEEAAAAGAASGKNGKKKSAPSALPATAPLEEGEVEI